MRRKKIIFVMITMKDTLKNETLPTSTNMHCFGVVIVFKIVLLVVRLATNHPGSLRNIIAKLPKITMFWKKQ